MHERVSEDAHLLHRLVLLPFAAEAIERYPVTLRQFASRCVDTAHWRIVFLLVFPIDLEPQAVGNRLDTSSNGDDTVHPVQEAMLQIALCVRLLQRVEFVYSLLIVQQRK